MQDKSAKTVDNTGEDKSLEQLREAGYRSFDDYWNSPREFVDDVNYRRSGWSAVSLIELKGEDGGSKCFYLKRQENQIRYSLRHPFGVLTYQFEVEAVAQMAREWLPCVSVLDYGFRRKGGKQQGYVVTEAIDGQSLKDFASTQPDWSAVSEQMQGLATALFRMHSAGWQHGALYPVHIFMNWETEHITYIDLERARKRRKPELAAEADLFQFLKRTKDWPDEVLQIIFAPYNKAYPELVKALASQFPQYKLIK